MLYRIIFTLVFMLPLVLTGCALGPDHIRPETDLPRAWQPPLAHQGALDKQWWKLFKDPTLDRLVEQALHRNHDLAIAAATIEEARAYLGVARAAQLPMAELDGAAARLDPGGAQGLGASYRALGSISFDLDFWGKYRRATEAARAELLATEAAYKTVRLAVIAETAEAYFALLSTDRQLATAKNTLKTRRRAEELYRSRYKEGLSGEFEFRQSEVETTTALAQVQSLEITKVQAENALAVLTGASPREIISEAPQRSIALEALTLPAEIPAGLPSQLLSRRPDIIEAEELLHAATADIGVAKAAFFPDISLTGMFGWVSTDFTRFMSSGTREWSVGGNVLQPVFQGGRLSAQLEAANARQKKAYSVYQKVVQNAFREVQDALVANKISRERLKTIETQVNKLKRAEYLAKLRYDSGQTAFLEVLDAQRALFNAQMDLAKAHQAQLDGVVRLCRALGGGWDS